MRKYKLRDIDDVLLTKTGIFFSSFCNYDGKCIFYFYKNSGYGCYAYVYKILKKLELKGFIELKKEGRRSVIKITKKGKKVFDNMNLIGNLLCEVENDR